MHRVRSHAQVYSTRSSHRHEGSIKIPSRSTVRRAGAKGAVRREALARLKELGAAP
jgi:hypothetical protein